MHILLNINNNKEISNKTNLHRSHNRCIKTVIVAINNTLHHEVRIKFYEKRKKFGEKSEQLAIKPKFLLGL